jgi:hypothetical protein
MREPLLVALGGNGWPQGWRYIEYSLRGAIMNGVAACFVVVVVVVVVVVDD